MYNNLFVMFVRLIIFSYFAVFASTETINCDKVKYTFTEQGLTDHDSKDYTGKSLTLLTNYKFWSCQIIN